MFIGFIELQKRVISEEFYIDDLGKHKNEFLKYCNHLLESGAIDRSETEAFLTLCLDYYTYSLSGDVLIPDSMYDKCMKKYKELGNDVIFHASQIGKKKWSFIEHKVPGMVGTLDKIYSYDEIKVYLNKYKGIKHFVLAPKYDGISCSIEVKEGSIISAATRYDGHIGQDITALVKNSCNGREFAKSAVDGLYKCELCVSTKNFNELIKIKKYANRRSATSGIVNTPSNLEFARFVNIVPLCYYSQSENYIKYIAPFSETKLFYAPLDLMEDIEKMLESIRDKDFPFRVDGVVIYPIFNIDVPVNEMDILEHSVAYKCNTMEGKTKIRYGYFSVGRLGKAVPMAKVEPVEVNETIVEDVSLGSHDKFLSMNLLEGEEVIVYSAGDVIPQIKMPAVRTNFYNSEPLKIEKFCPYCQKRLTRINNEYFCTNKDCVRVITGRIANFLIKVGIVGFSDKTVESTYSQLGIRTIKEFLKLQFEDLIKVDGFEKTSAENLITELNRIKSSPISISKFIGALGIDKISEKKCRKIFECVTLNRLLRSSNKELEKIFWELRVTDGIGPKTATVFIDFIKENKQSIIDLTDILSLQSDIVYSGNIVFTGFRDENLAKELNNLGYEISNTVTGNTIAVITASIEKQSTKTSIAMHKGIPIYQYNNIDRLIGELKEN